MEREKILLKIKELKIKMGALWEKKGTTGPEILGLSIEIDDLLNEYSRTLDV